MASSYEVAEGEIAPLEDEEDIELDSEIEIASMDPEAIVENSEAKVFAVNTHDQDDLTQSETDSDIENHIEYKKETPPKQNTAKEKKIIDKNAKNALCQPGETVCVNSQFGVRRSSSHWHRGIDIRAPYGSPVKAFRAGKVLRVEYSGGYGKLIEILQKDGIVARYGHLSQFLVSVGATVRQGAVIGRVGSTGRSTGPHLHFELIRNKQQVNPLLMLSTASKVVTKGSKADALAAKSANKSSKSIVISKKAKITKKSKGTGKVIAQNKSGTSKKTSANSTKKTSAVKSKNTKAIQKNTAKKSNSITAKQKTTATQQKKGTATASKQSSKGQNSGSKKTKNKNSKTSSEAKKK